MANGTGGAQAPDSYGGNTNQGSGNANRGSDNRGRDKRRRNGRVEYRWPNGTWHSRPFGKTHRSNYGDDSGGTGGTGGAQAPDQPKVGPYLRAARNDANIEYGPLENSLNQRGLAIPSWFENYRRQVSAQQAQSQQYAAPIIQGAQQQAQAAGQVAPGVDPGSQAGEDATLAAAARAALGNSFATMLQGFQQVQNDYMTGRQTVASTAELGEQQQLARDRTATAKEKGQFIRQQRAKHKDDARQRRLENQAFGLDAADKAADNARQDRQDRQGRRDELNSVNKYGYTEREWRKMPTAQRQKIIRRFDAKNGNGKGGGDGKAGGFTPLQRRETKATVRKGLAMIKTELRGKSTAPTGFWQKAYDALVNNKGYDPLLARAIIQIARTGKAKSGVAKRVRSNYGIGLPSGKPVAVPPAYVLTPSPQAPAGSVGGPGQIRPT